MSVPANIASRLITAVLLPDTDSFFCRELPGARVALSPFHGAAVPPEDAPGATVSLLLSAPSRTWRITLVNSSLPDERFDSYAGHLRDAGPRIGVVLSALLRRRVIATVLPHGARHEAPDAEPEGAVRVDLSIHRGDDEAGLFLVVPHSLIRRLALAGADACSASALEEALCASFSDPSRLLPDLPALVAALSDAELQRLLYHLMNRRLLTPYQLMLMAQALPHEALRIKRNLSERLAAEVAELMRRHHGRERITRRDLAAGVYSIEEAVYCLMREHDDVSYAAFLREVQAANALVAALDAMALRDFRDWIVLIEADGLLYATLSACDEAVIARAIGDDPGRYRTRFERHVSTRKAESICELAGRTQPTATERLFAQAACIAEYRRQRMRQRSLGAESFPFLLRRLVRPVDVRHLLLAVGWFTLSTALKGVRGRYAQDLVSGLPAGARVLIEDVLRGAVNPNILHDELQISAARSRCVREIARLYEEGFIRPSD